MLRFLFACLLLLPILPEMSYGYYSNGRWAATATDPAVAPVGFPTTLTWSIAADGTPLSTGGTSNFVSFFDGLLGSGGGGTNLSQRPWFTFVKQSFDRWTELSGLAFVYEPADDGATHGNATGAIDVRGDVRLAGKFLDGVGGTNAQAGFIPNADLTVDTGDSVYFGNATNSYRALRNTLMHEIGHAFGLGHVDSNSAAFLMEGFSNNSFEGPQLDDVRGVQALYGDKYERLAGTGGNESIEQASMLGVIDPGTSLKIGTHAATGTLVLSTETDFASIANQSDVDFYSFTLSGAATIDLTVTPLGASYNERIGGSSSAFVTTNAAQLSNLDLALYAVVDGLPTQIGSSNAQPLGVAESLLGVDLTAPGDYFVRIAGSSAATQLYQLEIKVDATIEPTLGGDFDLDGDVDGADFLTWQQGAGSAYDDEDLAAWRANFGALAGGNVVNSTLATPEPSVWALAGIAACCGWNWRKRRYRTAKSLTAVVQNRADFLKPLSAPYILALPRLSRAAISFALGGD
ncbi:MAG: hypothetical protein C0485_17800 [Pirellula sp.]|nr:hypothetical protein [Pirellula sp.]